MPITIIEADKILKSVFPDWVNKLDLRMARVEHDRVSMIMPPAEQILRLGQTVAGQASMALVDTAMVVALANAFGAFRPVGTVGISFSFMRPMGKADIVCDAWVLRLGRSMAFCRAELHEAGSDRIAIDATGTYALPPAADR